MLTILNRYQVNKQAKARGEETEEGFTLIELLIVIVVLGILAAVTVFALSGTTAKSAAAACDSDAQTVNSALAAYNAQAVSGTTPLATSTNLVPNYIQSWPSSSHYTIGLAGTVVGSQNVTVTAGSGTGAPVNAAFPAAVGGTDPCSFAK